MSNCKLIGLVLLGLFAIALVVGVYVAHFNAQEVGGPSEWAQFGDYVGGVANPLLGFVTILLLVISLKYQSDELAATRDEISQSRIAMERANELHSNNILVQSRSNLRAQLQQHYAACLASFDLRCKQEYFAFHRGLAHAVSLDMVVNVAGKEKPVGTVEEVLFSRPDDWKGAGWKAIAISCRQGYLDAAQALVSLIEYTDSEVTVDWDIEKFSSLRVKMECGDLFSGPELEKISTAIRESKEAREALQFPPFHKKSIVI
ncbi:MAG: hypothetical protein VX256_14220 [Pseudomonadota bacterium]|nr:hypothetical protein [Pseudomonadota bacterium]